MKNFFNEFKKFISRGNVIDLAVGVIIGSAFTAFVVFCMVKAINIVQDKMTKKPEKEETPAEPTKKDLSHLPVRDRYQSHPLSLLYFRTRQIKRSACLQVEEDKL